jgi:hypothetical protein
MKCLLFSITFVTAILQAQLGVAAPACPGIHELLNKAFEKPNDRYLQFRDEFGVERFARVIQKEGKTFEIEDQFGRTFLLNSSEVTAFASKESKQYFHSPMKRIEAEGLNAGSARIPVMLEVTTSAENGAKLKQWAHGEAIRPNPYGSKIEQHAYSLEKIGKTLIASDEATQLTHSLGYFDVHVKVKAPGSSRITFTDVIALPENEILQGQLPKALSHEGTHAYLDHLNQTGEGTSFSITFHDSRPIQKGAEDFYQSQRSLEEHVTWIQDLLRLSRMAPESNIVQAFAEMGSIKPRRIIRMNLLETQINYTRKLLDTSLPRLQNSLGAIKNAETMAIQDLSRAMTRRKKLKGSILLDMGPNQKIEIPINTSQERGWAKQLNSGSPISQKAKSELITAWKNKIEEQIKITTQLKTQILVVEKKFKLIKDHEKITFDEYRDFKKSMVELTRPIRLRNAIPKR